MGVVDKSKMRNHLTLFAGARRHPITTVGDMSKVHSVQSSHSIVADTAGMVWEDVVGDFTSFRSHPLQSAVAYVEGLALAAGQALINPSAIGAGLALKALDFAEANTLGREQMLARGIASTLDDPLTIATLGLGSVAAAVSRFGVMATEMGVMRAATTVAEAQNLRNVGVGGSDEHFLSAGGRQLTTVKATLDADNEAQAFYNEIRNSSSNADVVQISKNTGIPEYRIQRIKDHVFINQHDLGERVSQFDPYIEIADAWNRLLNGNFVEQDIRLLQHEYFESRFESLFKTNYTTAHKAANDSGRTWDPESFLSPASVISRRY
jgi:hypothetical protein